ncbi:MAG: hypothetical protein BRC31_00525 [Actinobacteria bacterium QS_5_72_10]|jgi:hypothetical protein|nr:MAG: hypothetical protein BRC32_06490 [Actinobacteria bacterium QS_8_72_14]PSO55591.1 MAG: hypothetical protein BRC31_00525 [Actinobacteria bacterium QS_5_72_10]
MVLWWIANIVLIVIVFPVVVVLLRDVLTVTKEIDAYAKDALEHGVLLIAQLDTLDDLDTTAEASERVNAGVQRYCQALERLT